MPLIQLECDTGDGPNWYNRAKIVYLLMGGNLKKALSSCKGNKEIARNLRIIHKEVSQAGKEKKRK